MCHQGHFYVWSLGRGPEKHKQLVEQLRKVVCVKPGVPDLPVKVADRLHHSQVGYCYCPSQGDSWNTCSQVAILLHYLVGGIPTPLKNMSQ